MMSSDNMFVVHTHLYRTVGPLGAFILKLQNMYINLIGGPKLQYAFLVVYTTVFKEAFIIYHRFSIAFLCTVCPLEHTPARAIERA
jgi:hypothetical protein